MEQQSTATCGWDFGEKTQTEKSNLSPLIMHCYPTEGTADIILHLFKFEHDKEKLYSVKGQQVFVSVDDLNQIEAI